MHQLQLLNHVVHHLVDQIHSAVNMMIVQFALAQLEC